MMTVFSSSQCPILYGCRDAFTGTRHATVVDNLQFGPGSRGEAEDLASSATSGRQSCDSPTPLPSLNKGEDQAHSVPVDYAGRAVLQPCKPA